MATTYTFKFADGKIVTNSVTGLIRRVEDVIIDAAARNGGSSAGKKTNRGMRKIELCLTWNAQHSSHKFM